MVVYLSEKTKESLKYSFQIVERFCKNFRIDKRGDYDVPSNSESIEDGLLDVVCVLGRRLIKVNHTVWITKKKKAVVPPFLTPTLGTNHFKVPEDVKGEDVKQYLIKVFKKKFFYFIFKKGQLLQTKNGHLDNI